MNPIAQHREAVKALREHPGAVLDEARRVAVPIKSLAPKPVQKKEK